MKRFIHLFLLTLGVSIPLTGTSLPVSEAIVYKNMALVNRQNSFTFRPGENILTFDNLPADIHENSLKAIVSGNDLYVSTLNSYLVPETGKSPHSALLDEITALNKELIRRNNSIEQLENKIRLTQNILTNLGHKISGEVFSLNKTILAEWKTAQGHNLDIILKSEKEISDNRRRIALIEKKLKALEEKLDKYRSELSRMKRITVARIINRNPAVVQGNLKISYKTSFAGWKPVYNMIIDKSHITFQYAAEFFQNTGNQWENITLVLSTAEPDSRMIRPRLASKKLFSRIAETNMQFVQNQVQQMTQQPTTRSEDKSGSMFYALPKKTTLNGSNTIQLFSFKHKKEIRLEAVPSRSTSVFQSGQLVNSLAFPLLPGKLMLYEDGEYVGRSSISYVAPGSSFAAPIGIDEFLSATSEETRSKEESLLGKQVARRIKTITLYNHGNSPARMNVKDRIPVSETEKVEISLNNGTTNGYKTDENNPGILTWEVTVPASSEIRIILDYTISYPKDSGLSF